MDSPTPGPLLVSLLHEVLDAQERRAALARAQWVGFEAMGRHYPPGYRDNDRAVFDDAQLAARLFARVRARLPARIVEHGVGWELVGLNERFRCCRYTGGQSFCIHRDGPHVRTTTERSLATLMIYLDDASEFVGGTTRFYASGPAVSAPIRVVVPTAGTAALFSHAIWHDGEAVTEGVKHVMRTDVMYRRESTATAQNSRRGSLAELARIESHLGYVWGLARGPDGTLWSVGRDGAVVQYEIVGEAPAVRRVLRLDGGSLTALTVDHQGAPTGVWCGDRLGRVHRLIGEQVLAPVEAHDGAVTALVVDGGRVTSAGADGRVLAWSNPLAAPLEVARHDGWVRAIARVGDGLASAGDDGVVRVDGRVQGRAPAAIRALASCGGGWIAGVANGSLLDEHGRVWPGLHAGAVTAIACAGSRVVTGGEDGVVRVCEVGALEIAIAVGHHDDFVSGLTLLGDGTFASASYDGTVKAWRWPVVSRASPRVPAATPVQPGR